MVTEEARLLNAMTARTEREAGKGLKFNSRRREMRQRRAEEQEGEEKNMAHGLWVGDRVRTREEGAYRQGDARTGGTDSWRVRSRARAETHTREM